MRTRKTDHIVLASQSIPVSKNPDGRFFYEPMLSAHPSASISADFFGKSMRIPLWISSMTGGSAEAGRINRMLAEACAEFDLGMGLGSCRILLGSNDDIADFNMRPILGQERPLFANIGISQLEQLLEQKKADWVHELVKKRLDADGLFIHVNPTQEWFQPEGDRQKRPAIEVIQEFSETVQGQYRLMVKEVGQGMGPKSLEALCYLHIDGIEFGAYGGTNFATVEMLRNSSEIAQSLSPLAAIGHSADEMLQIMNDLYPVAPNLRLIVSGGIVNFLDGYYFVSKSKYPSLYGMANVLLNHALISKKSLFDFIRAEIDGYMYAQRFLVVR